MFLECPRCPVPGQVCDQETGECICPPNTVGERCEDCAENSWNYNVWEGCQECQCNLEGANGLECDLYNGQCDCRPGYTGQKCDQCNLGHFDFPRCRQCKCHLAGTAQGQCRANGKCACDEEGQCPCKVLYTFPVDDALQSCEFLRILSDRKDEILL